MKYVIISLLFFVFSEYSISAQIQSNYDDELVFLKNYSPSPEAYSLMQYSDIPVSMYTGIPSISIPVYTIKVGSYNLPVSLNYHASGIKIAQEASRVGLGWSINAGGVISRTINEKDDFAGFWWDTHVVPDDTVNFHEIMFTREEDYEPDIFHYNFGEYSGKFYIKRGAGTLDLKEKFLIANAEDNLKIEYSDDRYGSFMITTPQNIKYIFDQVETKRRFGLRKDDGFAGDDIPDIYSTVIPDFSSSVPIISSWYLTKIICPDGNIINLEYDILYDSYISPINVSYNEIEVYSEQQFETDETFIWACGNNFYSLRPRSSRFMCIEKVERQPVLRKIKWIDGYMEFLSSNEARKDIRYFDKYSVPLPPPRPSPRPLGAISLYSSKSLNPIFSFNFHYSYFKGRNIWGGLEESASKYLFLTDRLKLDSISIIGNNSQSQSYTLEYDMNDALPIKNGYSADKWGYYTGKIIHSPGFEAFIAPCDYYGHRLENGILYHNPLFISMKKGETQKKPLTQIPKSSSSVTTWMLTSMTSPSDGRTDFKYECNKIYQYKSSIQYIDSISPIKIIKDYDNEEEVSVDFDIPYMNGMIIVKCRYDGNGNGLEGEMDTELVNLYRPNFSQIGIPDKTENTGSPIHERYEFTHKIPSVKSKCTITLKTSQRARLTVEINVYEVKDIHETYVGGARISEIKSPIGKREFKYEDEIGMCSGKLVRDPVFSNFSFKMYYVTSLSKIYGFHYYIENRSNSYQSLENPFNNYYMGYSRVECIKQDGDGNMHEVNIFHNDHEEKSYNINYVGKYLPLNGKLKTRLMFQDGKIILSENYHYKSIKIDTIKALKKADFSSYKYGYSIEKHHTYLSSDSIIICAPKQDIWIGKITTNQYEYNPNNFQVSRVLTKTTGEPVREKQIKYTVDYPNYNDGVFLKYNLINTPVEESFFIDNKLIKRTCCLHYNDSLIKPWKEFVYYNKGEVAVPQFDGNVESYNYIPNITYATYNSSNRNTSVQTKMGQSIVLLWGYKNQHIIAQIANATITDIEKNGIDIELLAQKEKPSVSDWEKLHSLRNLLPNSKVMITQYEPLIGIVSQTGPTGYTIRYTYDEFSRLKEQIEMGDTEFILQKNEYKYATEQ